MSTTSTKTNDGLTVSTPASTGTSLRDLLTARCGYHTYTATMGTNGNGGMLSRIDDILSADEDDQHLDAYELAEFAPADLAKHIRDATGYTQPQLEDMSPDNEWIAYDCAHETDNGYLTGGVSRIYVNLSI